MVQRQRLVLRSGVALMVGAIVFGVLSDALVRLNDRFDLAPWLGLTLTLLMYAVPGMLVGLICARHPLLHGAALGLVTVAVVEYHSHGQFVVLTVFERLEVLLFLAAVGVVVCSMASALANRVRSLTSNNALEQTRGQ